MKSFAELAGVIQSPEPKSVDPFFDPYLNVDVRTLSITPTKETPQMQDSNIVNFNFSLDKTDAISFLSMLYSNVVSRKMSMEEFDYHTNIINFICGATTTHSDYKPTYNVDLEGTSLSDLASIASDEAYTKRVIEIESIIEEDCDLYMNDCDFDDEDECECECECDIVDKEVNHTIIDSMIDELHVMNMINDSSDDNYYKITRAIGNLALAYKAELSTKELKKFIKGVNQYKKIAL
jgi:hypothetical protein